MGVQEVQDALDAALPTEPGQAVKKRLADLWPQISPSLLQALEARMKDRVEGIGKLLEERRHRDKVDIQVVMRELEKAIQRELDQPEALQLMLEGFSDDERDQLQANMDALRLRLAQIPGELEKEIAAIAARYADPRPRLFPVAVTFVVPERLA
jgi:transposase